MGKPSFKDGTRVCLSRAQSLVSFIVRALFRQTPDYEQYTAVQLATAPDVGQQNTPKKIDLIK